MKYLSFGIIALVSVLLVSCSHDEVKKKVEKPLNAPVAELTTTPDTLTSGGNYVNYAEKFVGVAPHTVIFFHADWCGTCHKVEQEILAGDIPDDINILVANYDTEEELKKKYGVTTQTTFVSVDAEGNLIEKWVKGDLATIIEKTLRTTPASTDEFTQIETLVSDTTSTAPVIESPQTEETVAETTLASETPLEQNDPAVSQVVEEKPSPVVTGGKYTPYSESLVGTSAHTVIYFHADWCPTCIRLEKNIQAGTIPNDINILKADFDTSKDLKKKYGVTSQTTLVHVDAQGNLVKKWVGGTLQTIIDNIEG